MNSSSESSSDKSQSKQNDYLSSPLSDETGRSRSDMQRSISLDPLSEIGQTSGLETPLSFEADVNREVPSNVKVEEKIENTSSTDITLNEDSRELEIS